MSPAIKICRVLFWITAVAVASIPFVVFFIIMSGHMDLSSAMGSSVFLLVAVFTDVYATYAVCLAAPLMLFFWWFGFHNKTDSANKVFVIGVLAGAFPFAFSFVVPILSLLSLAFSPGGRQAITQTTHWVANSNNTQKAQFGQNKIYEFHTNPDGTHVMSEVHTNPDGTRTLTPIKKY